MISAGPMTAARAAYTAMLLPDGHVLIAGGCTLDSCELEENGVSAELYDPRVRLFAKIVTMSTERVDHTATLLPSGEVLLAGGWDRDGDLASVEIYDPESKGFRTVHSSLGAARNLATVTTLSGGRALIAGGCDLDLRLAARTWLYVPAK